MSLLLERMKVFICSGIRVLQRNRTNRIDIDLDIDIDIDIDIDRYQYNEIYYRSWSTSLFKLRSPTICRLSVGQPGKPMVFKKCFLALSFYMYR